MCSIDKLLIKGIRSFSPENTHVIEFYRPLTLIVGQNGAGKTTVIECLKQACTGELPPNTRSGQSFIHDPKVVNEREVKGQIRLRIRTAQQAPVVIIRSFQLTQKKNALQFKALDQTVQTFNPVTNEKEAINYRCADMDRLIPQLMGVSKAVLENVIFVHQEDSNWPLAEGLVLKRKFDDIFSATKYTKALEALRKLRAEKTAEIKQFRLALDHTKTHKDMSLRLQKEESDYLAKMEQLNATKADLESKLAAHAREVKALDGKLMQFQEMGSRLERLQVQLKEKATSNGQMYARLQSTGRLGQEDFEMSAEEAQRYLDTLDSTLGDAGRRLRDLATRHDFTAAQLQEHQQQQKTEERRQAQLQAQLDLMHQTMQQRDQFARQAAADSGIVVNFGEGRLSEEAVAAFQAALRGAVGGQQAALEQAKAATRSADEEMGHRVNGVSAELAGIDENLRFKEEQMQTCASGRAQLQSQADRIHVTNAEIEEARELAEEGEAREQKARQDHARLNAAQERQRLEAALADLGRRITLLRQERGRLAMAGEAATKAKMKRRELQVKEGNLHEMVQEDLPRLAALLDTRGAELPSPEQLGEAVDHVVQHRREALTAAERSFQTAAAHLSACRATAEAAKQALRKLEEEAAAAQAKIDSEKPSSLSQATQPDEELPVMTRTRQALLAEAASNSTTATTIANLARTYKDMARCDGACHTCGRALSPAELPAFLARQDDAISEAPAKVREFEAEKARLQGQLDRLQELQPTYVRLGQLHTHLLPAAQQEVDTAEATAAEASERVKQLNDKLPALRRASEEAESLAANVVQPIAEQARQVDQARRECRAAEAAAGTDATGGRTAEEVEDELTGLDDQQRSLQSQQNDLNAKDLRFHGDVAAAARAYHTHREQLASKQHLAEKRASLKSQIRELSATEQSALSDAQRLRDKKPSLLEQLAQLKQERERQRREHQQQESRLDSTVQSLNLRVNQFSSFESQLQKYRDDRVEAGLSHTTAAIKRAVQAQQSVAAQVEDLQRQVTEAQKTIDSHKSNRSDAEELMQWITGKAAQDNVSAQIAALEAQIAEVGDVAAMSRQLEERQAAAKAAAGERHRIEGSLGTYHESLARCRRDLGQQVYRNVADKWRKQSLELKTTEMATHDLEKYHKALEKALLAFHTTKMTDINQTIKELWQKTYRNQDIDYIQVKADSEGVGARSYNYRVVMMAGGVELDMRGRCSAGQKVLACLIIRLALAETFCLACGILALDEPTTNLDAANAESLAGALRNVIDARRGQQNFQLIVITHDERFATLIGTREHAEHRWRITKDENQNSHIEQENIVG